LCDGVGGGGGVRLCVGGGGGSSYAVDVMVVESGFVVVMAVVGVVAEFGCAVELRALVLADGEY
jgi:hypothetical protein